MRNANVGGLTLGLFAPLEGRPCDTISFRKSTYRSVLRPATIRTNNRSIAMKMFALKIQKFLKSEDGPTAVEYAVMLALIVVVCLTTIQSLGSNANTTFSSVSAKLTSSS